MINKPVISTFFKNLTNHRSLTNWVVFLMCRPIFKVVEYRKYCSLDSHFFRTTSGTQSVLNAFDKTSSDMTFFKELGNDQNTMLFQFSSYSRLVLDECSQKRNSKQICFITCRRQHLRSFKACVRFFIKLLFFQQMIALQKL